ncbi:hypothetical protein [Cupriavidus basilensis]|uniref:hypothetical protein n=1 Tax=Cupriavidus basilensis TaxID=68895 RepID=UPI000751A715|nr:hypothetical protein [Cupriavidus basilensis]
MTAEISGQWDCVSQTPNGEQHSVLTIVGTGAGTFGGTNASEKASVEVTDGELDGDRVSFRMKLTSPLPLSLKVEAVLAGDTLEGTIAAGMFGRFPMRATRRA